MIRSTGDRVAAAWNHFWFAPMSTAPLALLRIAIGVLSLAWALSLSGDVLTFLANDGVMPDQPSYDGVVGPWHTIGLLGWFGGKPVVIAFLVALIVGSSALIVGFFTRIAAVVVFIAMVSLQRRNPFVFNSGDALLRNLTVFLALAPSGAALSIDRWRRAKQRFWNSPARAAWPLRLFQVQVCLVYFGAVYGKLRGTTWNDGTAVSYALRVGDYVRLPVPSFITHSLFISNVLTLGTIAIETALAILVWNRALRPWVLLLGVSLHLGIEYSMRVGFYSLAIFASYLAFVPPERAAAWLLALRERLSGSRIPVLRRLAAAPGTAAAS